MGQFVRGHNFQLLNGLEQTAYIGDLTGGGGIAATQNGAHNVIAASASKASATSGYAGVSLTSPKQITWAYVFGSSDQGFVNGATPTVTLELYGKKGAAPASATDGQILGSASFTDATNAVHGLDAADSNAAGSAAGGDLWLPADPGLYDHVWVLISHNGAAATICIAEIDFFFAYEPERLLGPGYTKNHPFIGYDNLVTPENLTADQEDANFPAVNLVNPSTSLKWKATSTADQYLNFNPAHGGNIGYVAIDGHNFGSTGCQIRIEITPAGYTTATFLDVTDYVTPTDDGPLIFMFDEQDYDYVWIHLVPGTGIPEAAVLYAGSILRIERKLYVNHRPINYQRETNSVQGMSESGQFLGRIILGRTSESAIDLQNITPDFYRDSMDPFLLAAEESPFFVAWRPGDYPLETAFAWLTDDPKPTNQRANGMMSVSLGMRAIA